MVLPVTVVAEAGLNVAARRSAATTPMMRRMLRWMARSGDKAFMARTLFQWMMRTPIVVGGTARSAITALMHLLMPPRLAAMLICDFETRTPEMQSPHALA